MDMLNLGIKFVREAQPIPIENVTSQTGDLSILLILCLLAVATVAFIIAIKLRNIQPVYAKNNISNMSSFEKRSLFSKISLVVIGFIVVSVITLCFSFNAFASSNENSLKADKETIIATVSDDYSFALDSCSISNIGNNRVIIDKSYVKLTDEVKEIEGLKDAKIKVISFGGIVFEGTCDSEYTPIGLTSLLPLESTNVRFEISFTDCSIVEKLCDKNVFTISLIPKIDFPVHETLEQYSWPELKIVADAFSNNSITPEESERFKNFAQQGQTKTLPLGPHDNVTEDYLYMRIIGINHDDAASGSGIKAGLTFMAANSINKSYYYEYESATGDPVYSTNWAESKLHESMNNGEIFKLLSNAMNSVSVNPVPVIKFYSKGWPNDPQSQYYDQTQLSINDTFFLPSYYEVNGKNDIYSGPEGTLYEYMKNDPWANVEGCKWFEPGVYYGPAPMMSSINWIGYNFFKTTGSDQLEKSAVDAFWKCAEVGGTVSDCEMSTYSMTRSVSTFRQPVLVPSSDGVLCWGLPECNPGLNAGVNNCYTISPCFCL